MMMTFRDKTCSTCINLCATQMKCIIRMSDKEEWLDVTEDMHCDKFDPELRVQYLIGACLECPLKEPAK